MSESVDVVSRCHGGITDVWEVLVSVSVLLVGFNCQDGMEGVRASVVITEVDVSVTADPRW